MRTQYYEITALQQMLKKTFLNVKTSLICYSLVPAERNKGLSKEQFTQEFTFHRQLYQVNAKNKLTTFSIHWRAQREKGKDFYFRILLQDPKFNNPCFKNHTLISALPHYSHIRGTHWFPTWNKEAATGSNFLFALDAYF